MKRDGIVKVVIPMILKQKLKYIYLTVARNAVDFKTVTTFIFSIGLDVFYQLVIDNKTLSFMEMLRIAKYLKSNVRDYIQLCNHNEILLPLGLWHYLNHQFEIHKFTNEDINKFISYLQDYKAKLFEDSTILTRERIKIVFEKYLKTEIKYRNLY